MRAIPDQLVREYESAGWWTQDSLGDLLARGLAASPDIVFRVHSPDRPWSGTVGDVETVARRLAAGLRKRGVQPGDVVAFQLPNCMEAAAVFWASALLGAVVVPVVHFYRHKELSYIFSVTRPKVFFATTAFQQLESHEELSSDVAVLGLVGGNFEELLEDEPFTGVVAVDPAQPALIAFTSGTTTNPKGVVHSHRSLGFESRQLAAGAPPDAVPSITAAPVGHFIGMLNAFLIPLVNGTPVNLIDGWRTEQVLSLLADDELTVGGGVPYYFTSVLDHPDVTPAHLRNLKYAPMGGSAVPPAVGLRLQEAGMVVYRAYGSTEHPSISASAYDAPEDKRLYTDGQAMLGVEIRLTEEGEILSRGPDLALGYVDAELTAATFDEDGWYHTGDIGVLDEDGYLTITDRKSDIIIRGGENISALEVEDALLRLSAVAEAAVVAVPDPRLGERAAAVLRLRPGHTLPSLDEVRVHLDGIGLAKQKWPEQIHEIEDLPRTPSGKVQKYRLRQRLAAEAAQVG